MAELLKREFELLSLRVAMDVSGDAPAVALELQGEADGQRLLIGSWTSNAASIGLPARLDRSVTSWSGYGFRLPDELVGEIQDRIAQAETGQRPLWLHLAKPLGYLNLVPWEELLQPVLKMPILRLPDFVAKPPSVSDRRLEVALCASVPMAKAAFTAAEHVTDIARIIAGEQHRQPIVHVFCDAALFDDVRRRISSANLADVHVHDPAHAESFAPAERKLELRGGTHDARRFRNPWLLWMCEVLRGRSIDVVHFLTHGYLWRDRGALAFAESPLENMDRRVARFVAADELLAFYTQIGAWVAAFSSPENNYSEIGLRLLADTIAQSRPGPVLHHELRLDMHKNALDDAYRLLLGGSRTAPCSPAIFVYCHPALLESAPRSSAGRSPQVGQHSLQQQQQQQQQQTRSPQQQQNPQPQGQQPAPSLMEDLYRTSPRVPAWVGSSQRYLERRRSELQQRRLTDPSVNEKLHREQSADARIVEDTLQRIENVLGNVLASKLGGK